VASATDLPARPIIRPGVPSALRARRLARSDTGVRCSPGGRGRGSVRRPGSRVRLWAMLISCTSPWPSVRLWCMRST
jgi:hypothetical protein